MALVPLARRPGCNLSPITLLNRNMNLILYL